MMQHSKDQIEALDSYYASPRDLVELFEGSVARHGDRPAIGTKDPTTKKYRWATYREIAARVDNLRAALHALGLASGEAVGVIIHNTVDWFVIEQAVHGLGGRFVPMYEKELAWKWKYMIRDANVRYLFVRDAAILDKVQAFQEEIPGLAGIFTIYGGGDRSLGALEERGRTTPVPSIRPHWSEVAVLIYTSGTTGDPKGVLLTHGNLTACSQAGYRVYPNLNKDSVALSILPWAHSYALSAELHNFLQFGGAIGLMESLDTLAEDFLLVRPTHLMCVPRVFNKIYNGIMMRMEQEGWIKKRLFLAACRAAKQCRGRPKSLELRILDRLVFSKIRARFGGRLLGALTASAVMNVDVALFFADIGIDIYDCYGLTETAPAITMNSPARGNRYGSVGKPVGNMHVVIDRSLIGSDSPDGEILAYGAHVMLGYHNKPVQTAAIMTENTWNGFPGIRTGDLGRFDDDGFLYVTGRCKDEYKLSNGKYVHPESIENEMKLVLHVANAFVYGAGKEYNVAIIVPDFETVRRDPATARWAHLSPEELVRDESFREFVIGELGDQLRKTFAGYELPRKHLFVERDFTLDNAMLTQTMKVVRREVLKEYGERLEALYEETPVPR
jgi:long-chain acyl-CoA synthetase